MIHCVPISESADIQDLNIAIVSEVKIYVVSIHVICLTHVLTHKRCCFRLSSMAPVLACRVLPGIEVTMGYERDDNTRWGNWPHTSLVQAVKNMGARHNGHEPYISLTGVPSITTHISQQR